MDKEGKASLPEQFRFSLSEFCRRMDALLQVLDGSVIGVEQAVEAVMEARSNEM
jgi:hypothetical protein